MSICISPSPTLHPHPHPPMSLHPHPHPPMSLLHRLTFSSPFPSKFHRHTRLVSASLPPPWTQAPLSFVDSAAESLFNISIDVSSSPHLAASYTRPGQYLQLRLPNVHNPSFLAIASPPQHNGEFHFLVKNVAGSTAELLCGLRKGDIVELSAVMGNGFDIHNISPPHHYNTVLIFATGSGISPIRSLIESGFGAEKRSDVRLFYGARNLQRMAYQERFKAWESLGVKIIPVLSQPNANWTGETGFVQAAFSKNQNILSPSSTGAVLCGQKQMIEEVTALLVADGVSTEKILKNF